jgi:glycosyltransferase involved in cell wall biosynthesis
VSANSGISVVVPVRDGERYVGAAVASLLANTLRPEEVIVVADGCTDRSAQAARAAGATLVVEVPASGPGAARNLGVAHARCPLLAFLDADDLASPSRFEVLAARLAAEPTLDGVVGAVETFVSPDRPDLIGTALPPVRAGRHAGTVLFRRSAFDRVGPFDEDPVGGPEVVDWFVRAAEAGLAIGTVDDVVLRRRIHGDNLTTRVASRVDLVRTARAALLRRRS